MKISTKGRYGVRIMLELALSYNAELLTVKNIAEKQEISEKYIEQIISILNKSGLVRSQRGAAGGYKLAGIPRAITVGQILRATEGGLTLVDCISPEGAPCSRREDCPTADIWAEMTRALEQVVDNITLEDLINRYNDKCSYSYVI